MSREGLGTLYALLHPRRAALPDGATRDRDLAGSARAHRAPEGGLQAGLRVGLVLCAFTSSSTDFRYACAMACFSVGTILEFTLLEGFQLDDVSLFPRESEALLPPNRRFAVSSAGPTTKTVFSGRGEVCQSMCPETQTSRVI